MKSFKQEFEIKHFTSSVIDVNLLFSIKHYKKYFLSKHKDHKSDSVG